MANKPYKRRPETCSTCKRWSRYGRQLEGYCIRQRRPTKSSFTCGEYIPERKNGTVPYYDNNI